MSVKMLTVVLHSRNPFYPEESYKFAKTSFYFLNVSHYVINNDKLLIVQRHE